MFCRGLISIQISEVKNWFAEHKKQYDDQALKVEASKHSDDFIKGPTFLFGGSKLPEYSDILASVPGRLITDKIIARYWNSYDPSIRKFCFGAGLIPYLIQDADILHPPSWQRLVCRLVLVNYHCFFSNSPTAAFEHLP